MKLPKTANYLLRLAVTAGAFFLAFSHVDIRHVLPLLAQLPLPIIVAALLLLHAGQVMSAQRTRFYVHCQGIDFPVKPSLKLHYVGGLFNVFLPGGAGGDAYKAWWLKRHKKGRLLNMVKVMIAARLNGLWMLGVLLCILAWFSTPLHNFLPQAPLLILALLIVGSAVYMLLAKLMLKEPLAQQIDAALYSLGVQVMQVGVAYLLCVGLGLQANALSYILLFLLSSMLAMLPISIGGIGVRELAVLHGTQLLGLSPERGVALAFSFTVLSLTIPLAGAVIYGFFAPQGTKEALS